MRRRKALAVGAALVVLGAAVAVVATGTIDTPLTEADTVTTRRRRRRPSTTARATRPTSSTWSASNVAT